MKQQTLNIISILVVIVFLVLCGIIWISELFIELAAMRDVIIIMGITVAMLPIKNTKEKDNEENKRNNRNNK